MGEIDYSKPFPVSIAQDCRQKDNMGPEGDLSLHMGICVGYYKLENHFERLSKLKRVAGDDIPGNPLIYVPSKNAFIWGAECFWIQITPDDKELAELAAMAEQKVTKGEDPLLEEILTRAFDIKNDFSRHYTDN